MKLFYFRLFCCIFIILGLTKAGLGNGTTTISSITPSVCYRGNSVTFTGNNISSISGIRLNNVVIDQSYLRGVYPGYFELEIPRVPIGNYKVVITTPGGIVTAPGMLVVTVNSAILPVFSSVNPLHAEAGNYVTVTGNNLLSITGITMGVFHADINSLYTINGSSFAIQIPNIPHGAYQLTGVNEEGSGYGTPISIDGPNLISVTPAANEIDKTITVNGIRLYAVNAVTFGNVRADMNTFTQLSDQQFSITVPYVSQTGVYNIVAYTAFDHTDALNFSISGLNIPFITQAIPSTAAVADRITLQGGNFAYITGVTFGSTLADPTSIISFAETSLSVLVPFIPSGENDIVVYTKRGVSAPLFFSLPDPQPSITNFAPTSVKIGDVLSINGNNLGSARSLIINNFTTIGITIVSEELITAVVPNGASTGMVSMATLYGTINSPNVLPVDTVTSIREVPPTTSGVSGIANATKTSPVIFPNPYVGFIYLANSGDNVDIIISNSIGELVYSGNMIKNGGLDIRHLPEGMYVLTLKSETGHLSRQKIILTRSVTR